MQRANELADFLADQRQPLLQICCDRADQPKACDELREWLIELIINRLAEWASPSSPNTRPIDPPGPDFSPRKALECLEVVVWAALGLIYQHSFESGWHAVARTLADTVDGIRSDMLLLPAGVAGETGGGCSPYTNCEHCPMNQGVLTVSVSNRVIFANHAAEELFGPIAPGSSLAEIMPGLPHLDDRGQHDQQIELRTKDGREIELRYRCTPISVGGVRATALAFCDFEQLKHMRDDLGRLKRLSDVGQMCSVLAHEIRNPLAGIKATLQSMENDAVRSDLHDSFSTIQHEVDRLEGMLSGLFGFVKNHDPRRQMAELSLLVHRALECAKPYLKDRVIDVNLHGTDAIWVDAEQLQQVLLNLLINAADATCCGGAISIDGQVTNHVLALSVEDDGDGIDQQTREQIFEPFFTTKDNGLGLGLAVCSRIVQVHGGKLSVDSVPGKGAKFTIRLPMGTPS